MQYIFLCILHHEKCNCAIDNLHKMRYNIRNGGVNMALSDKLKKARLEAGLSQAELADRLGLNVRTYGSYERGERDVSTSLLRDICQTLNISSDELLENEFTVARKRLNPKPEPITPNAEILPNTNIHMIPVFESVAAGFGAYACSDVVDYIPLLISNPADVSEMLCIKVTGDSMYPKIENGDMVVVRKQSSIDSGQIAVILLDKEEGLVKRIVYGDNYIELQSINPEYPPKVFKGRDMLRIDVVGVVKQIIKNI